MEKNELFIPLYAWLLGGSRIGGRYNQYFGSCTEHPEQAAIGQKVFNYTIFIEKHDETEILKAAVYYGLQSFQNTNPEAIIEKTFVCEADSLPAVREWLTSERDAYFAA